MIMTPPWRNFLEMIKRKTYTLVSRRSHRVIEVRNGTIALIAEQDINMRQVDRNYQQSAKRTRNERTMKRLRLKMLRSSFCM